MSVKPMISASGRNTLVAAFASLALITASASPSAAASSTSVEAASKAMTAGQSDVTDFSAARRRHYYRRGPNAAGLAFMGMAAGLIGGAIAESRRQEYYENRYYYGPRPYYGGPGYYGGDPYYGSRYYYQPY